MSRSPVAIYLAELGDALAVSSPLRERILEEVEDHLREATAQHRAAGINARAAEQRAIDEFGPPGPTASAFEGFESTDRREVLRATRVLGSLPEPELEWLAEQVGEVDFDPGETIIEQGAFGRECYVIVEGDADVVLGGMRVASVGAGHVVGEMGLVLRKPRVATVVAKTPVSALVLRGEDLDRGGEAYPAIAEALMSLAVARMRNTA